MPIYSPKLNIIAGSNISVTNTTDSSTIAVANVGSANGIASLDANGKVPSNQLPNSVMEYKGVWNAAINDPYLVDGVGNAGDVYRVGAAGTHDFGNGSISFEVGDYCIYSGSVWQKSDTTDAVTSVNTKTGAVVLDTSDIADTTDKRYITDAQQTSLASLSGTNTGDQFLFKSVQVWNTFNTMISPTSTLPVVADQTDDILNIYGANNIQFTTDPGTDSIYISTVGRATLLDNTDYYVSTTGSDTTGTGSPVAPWRTIQFAVNYIATLDCNAKNINIYVADGTYAELVSLRNCVGVATATQLKIIGNTSTPANCIVNGFFGSNIAHQWNIDGFRVGSASTSGIGVSNAVIGWRNIRFGLATTHMDLSGAGKIFYNGGSYTIAGNASAHVNNIGQAFCNLQNATISIVGTLSIGTYFICNYLSLIWNHNSTWSGTGITGKRFSISSCSVLYLNSATPDTYLALAGNSSGTAGTNAVQF